MARRVDLTPAVAVVPLLAAGAVATVDAADREMWNNEYASWHAATLSFPDLGHLLSNTDLVHTAYLLLMKGWIGLAGDSPLALRMPSIAATALTAGLLALLGRRLVSTPVGLVAGLLYAVTPAVSRYAQEARSYALVSMMVVLTTLLLARAMAKPVRLRWILYALGVVVTGWLHFASLVVLAAHLVLVLREAGADDPRRYRWAGSVGAAALGIIPLLSFASAQAASISWIKADLPAVRAFPHELFLSWWAAAGLVGLGLLGTAALLRHAVPPAGPPGRSGPTATPPRRPSPTAAWPLLVWAVLPPVFVYLTYPVLHMFLARYVLYTVPAWCLLAAAGVCGLAALPLRRAPSWTWILGAALLLPGFALAVLPDQRTVRESPVTGQPDYRAAIDVIREEMRSDDGIAYNDVFGELSDLAREAVDYEMRAGPKPRDVFLAQTSAQRGSYSAAECAGPGPCLSGDIDRIWLISTTYSPDPLGGLPQARLAELGDFIATLRGDFPGVRLVLLVRDQSAAGTG